ncbi:MAG: phosphoglucomutase/phosphomannomutase family protein, partial [Gammaproteobacteria bacterium]
MKARIKFGTSGWRAIIAEEFTFANVRRAIGGITRYVAQNHPGRPVIIGRDPRFLGEACVALAAEVVSTYGIKSLVGSEVAPTPAIAFEILRRQAAGGINFTASHNPPEYN